VLSRIWRVAARVKGVFRLKSRFVTIALGPGGDVQLRTIAFRRESRLEIIAHERVPGEVAGAHNGDLAAATKLDVLQFSVHLCDWECVEECVLLCLQ
jgi:hypothetical protein